MSKLNTLSKIQIVAVGRALGVTMGDFCIQKKQELIDRVLSVATDDEAFDKHVLMTAPPHLAQFALTGAAQTVRTESSAEAFVAPTYPDIKVVGEEKASVLFKKNTALLRNISVEVWNDPLAPRINPHYRFDAALLADALVSINRQRSIWLAGPAGTGKTEFVKQVAARLGRAVIRVQFDASLEAYHIIGGERVKNASTRWQDGLVLQGFRRPGAIILLDEVGFARSEYTSALHAALEPDGNITVPETGEVIDRAPGVCFMAADNSNGRGDTSGVYVGVREQNNAFLSRFAKTLYFKYLPVEEEAGIISDVSGANIQLSTMIAEFIAICRGKADTGELESPPSMRESFYLAEDLADGIPPRRAFENTIVNRAPADCHEILQQLWVANVNNEMVEKAAAGEAVTLLSRVAAPTNS